MRCNERFPASSTLRIMLNVLNGQLGLIIEVKATCLGNSDHKSNKISWYSRLGCVVSCHLLGDHKKLQETKQEKDQMEYRFETRP